MFTRDLHNPCVELMREMIDQDHKGTIDLNSISVSLMDPQVFHRPKELRIAVFDLIWITALAGKHL